MKLHILQHVPFEGPAYIAKWATNHEHKLSYTLMYEEEHVFPDLKDIDALVIMGGPMSVHDEEKYLWLSAEKKHIKDCINSGKKVLGICLGAQLIASCLGASVHKADFTEIGWYPVKTNLHANQHNWLEELFKDAPVVFHWHGEQFEIPSGAIDLLYSDANLHQAYLYHKQVLALQFHLEATEQSILSMITNCSDELQKARYVQSEEEIKQGFNHIPTINSLMERILNRFFEGI